MWPNSLENHLLFEFSYPRYFHINMALFFHAIIFKAVLQHKQFENNLIKNTNPTFKLKQGLVVLQ